MSLWRMGAVAFVCSAAMTPGAREMPPERQVPAYWVFLNTGANRAMVKEMSEAAVNKMQADHVGNFGAQFDKGKLFTAGPLGDNGLVRGIVVVNARNAAEVAEAFKPDPFVQNRILDPEAYPWIVDISRFGTPKVPFKISQYTLGVVKKGARWTGPAPEPAPDSMLRLMPNLRRLDRTGALAIHGPLVDAGDKLGILLFVSPDQARVKAELDAMESVKSWRVAVDLHPQYLGTGVLRDPAVDTAPPKSGARISLSDPGLWEGETRNTWRIEKGVFTGGSLAETNPHNDFLCTRKEYRNFDLRMKVKLTGTGFVNGGIQIRSQRAAEPAYEMVGYQADMGAGYWGSLYDESRRNKVLAHTHSAVIDKILKPNDWNEYAVRCEGRRIRLWLNRVLTVDYTEPDDSIPTSGRIGLQIHGGGKSLASYKDITIQELAD